MAGVAVKVCSLRPLAVAAERVGLSLERVLADVGLDPELAHQEELEVSFTLAQAAWDRAGALAGPAFGLRAGTSIPFGAYGLLDFVTWAGGTVGDAWGRFCRYMPVLGGFTRASLTTTALGGRIRVLTAPGTSRHAIELGITMSVARTRAFADPRWCPAQVSFQHAPGAPLEEYTRALGVLPEFEAEEHAVTVDAATLARPLTNPDPEVAIVLQGLAERRLAHTTGSSLVDRVRREVLEDQGRAPTLTAVAGKLRTPPRTLQRQLAQAGTSLSAIVDDVRRELALAYLADAKVAITEIAYLVGFADPSAFDRAVRRWTGSTPTRWRADQGVSSRTGR